MIFADTYNPFPLYFALMVIIGVICVILVIIDTWKKK